MQKKFLSNLTCCSKIFYEFSKQTNISRRYIKYNHLYPYMHSHVHVHIFSQASIMSARLICDSSCFIQTTCCRLVPTSSEKSTHSIVVILESFGIVLYVATSCSTLIQRVMPMNDRIRRPSFEFKRWTRFIIKKFSKKEKKRNPYIRTFFRFVTLTCSKTKRSFRIRIFHIFFFLYFWFTTVLRPHWFLFVVKIYGKVSISEILKIKPSMTFDQMADLIDFQSNILRDLKFRLHDFKWPDRIDLVK